MDVNPHHEVYRFGPLKFDVDRANKLIATKSVAARLEKAVDMTEYARVMLALKPRDTRRPVAIFTRIDYDYLSEIDSSRLQEPGICVRLKDGQHLLIDGNHRLARKILGGDTLMDLHLLSESQCRKHKILISG